ncbi:MAG: hypothetical protein OHK0046_43110 [Anaerolineae bacterium]
MSSETILVVDDSAENRDFIVKYVLEPNTYQVLVAEDGREGLAIALQHKPDLILLDYNMPRLNGLGVLKALREQNIDIPVIIMTFHGSEDLAVDVFRLGVKDYIVKPFYPEDMERAIARSLTESRLRKEKDALTERVIQANRDLQLRLQELNVLYNIGKRVASLVDMEQLMPRVVDAALQMTQAEQGSIYLLVNEELVCQVRRRMIAGKINQESVHAEAQFAQHVLKTRQPLTLTRDQARGINGSTSAAYVPLILGEEVIGVLGVENLSQNSRSFTQHDSALLSALSDYASIAIANFRSLEALKRAKEHEKEEIRWTFERFVSPAVVDHALSQEIETGGKRREITALFAEIRGYTSWSENAAPEQVLDILNHYLSMAADVVLAWEGTIDKFYGDGVMAMFNAPYDQPDHVHRAADAAIALMKAADEVSAMHGYRLSYSVGIHVGEAVVGYIGTERAVSYTAVGQTVMLAKRLQEYAAPGQILVEESVIQRLGSAVQARPLGEMKVKGRKKGAFVFELNGLRAP